MKKYVLFALLFSLSAFAQEPELTVCEGVTEGLISSSWCRIENECRLYVQKNGDENIVEINTNGELIQKNVQNGCLLFDGSKDSVNEYNQPSVNSKIVRETSTMKVKGFQSDTEKTKKRADDPEKRIITDANGVVVLNGLMLSRNNDMYSMDAPEATGIAKSFHSTEWDIFSVTIVPYSKFMSLLKDNKTEYTSEMKEINPNFVYPDRYPIFLSKNFIYSTEQTTDLQRDVIKRIFRNKIQETKLYNFAGVTGPYFNDKSWPQENTCEFYDCDIVGAQVLSYDTTNYGIIKWNDLTKDNHDGIFVVAIQAGDGGADADDLMGLFIVYKETLESGNRIIYKQINTRSGVDFILEFQLKV